ncbi:PTS transporter subunit EIIC [Aeromonas veronii]|uniref:PTS transporter subunit EIIC n=1 Tax=Aeromonas veronii TaxID=654 RepID=UPI002443E854|nr:PTS transporter subunit EIIC [Aeromonas veronii]
MLAMLIFARSQHIKKMTRLAAGSSIFNINEPILFGLPVIMNPIMLIPFNLVPVVLVTIQYIAMASGVVSTTTGVYIPWTLPPCHQWFYCHRPSEWSPHPVIQSGDWRHDLSAFPQGSGSPVSGGRAPGRTSWGVVTFTSIA